MRYGVPERIDLRMERKTNYKSVKWVLLSLNLCDYTRVCIREHGLRGIVYVGGGYPGNVMRRYADRLVMDSCIFEDALILYVAPLDRAEQQVASGSAAGADVLPE